MEDIDELREKARHYTEACRILKHNPDDPDGLVDKVISLAETHARLKVQVEETEREPDA